MFPETVDELFEELHEEMHDSTDMYDDYSESDLEQELEMFNLMKMKKKQGKIVVIYNQTMYS